MMKSKLQGVYLAFVLATVSAGPAFAEQAQIGKSPWGAGDQIGRLNMMTEQSKAAILSRISAGVVYDLSTEYSWACRGGSRPVTRATPSG